MSKIAETIQKLLAKADSTTHPEEAEVFLAKAHQLLEQHGISLLDLGMLEEKDPVGFTHDENNRANSSALWRTRLANAVANFYGCQTVTSTRGNFQYWTVFGRESARVTFMLMYPYIERQVLAQARANKDQFNNLKSGHRMIGDALTLRIWELIRARKPVLTPSQSSALVPVDMIREKMKEMYPNLRKGPAVTLRTSAAAQKAAAAISLDNQIGGKGVLKIGVGD